MRRFALFILLLGALLADSPLAHGGGVSAPVFEKDVLPILTANCLNCHGGYRQKGDLDLRTIASIFKGGESGPAVQPGPPAKSLLWQKVSADEMPKGLKKLSAADKKTIQDWIDAGAPGQHSQKQQALQLPGTPRPAAEVAADIDREIDQRLQQAGLTPGPLADDAEFLRRVYLDVTGRIPTADQARAFLDSKAPDLRARLIDELLASSACDKHFATTWHNLLVPFVDGKRVYDEPFRKWLTDAFGQKQGWDQVARAILTAEGEARTVPQIAFFAGLPEPNEATDAVGRLFLGIQLECAECHNSPMTVWRQKEDFWGLAAFFGRIKVTVSKNGKNTNVSEAGGHDLVKGVEGPGIRIHDLAARHGGEVIPPGFLGTAPAALPGKPPFRPAFADWAVSPQNPYFAQAAVNRWWAQFFGQGLVNPIDDFREGNPPSHPRLLAILQHEFIVSGFDLKHLARCLAGSKAYQRTSAFPAGTAEQERELYARAPLRMLTPEMFHNSLGQVLGVKGQLANFLPPNSKSKNGTAESDFVNFFAAKEGPFNPAEYSSGIVQILHLLNARQTNELPSTSALSRIFSGKVPPAPEAVIEQTYLIVLSRRPTEAEAKTARDYVLKHPDLKKAAGDLAWALMNGSEFSFNH